MSPKKIEKIKEAVLRTQEAGGERPRYSDEVKKAVVEILSSGVGLTEASRLTGVRAPTILKWSRRVGGGFREVAISPEADARGETVISIILPGGLRIECPSMAQLKDILGYLK